MTAAKPGHLQLRVATRDDAAALASLLIEMDDDTPPLADSVNVECMLDILGSMNRYPDFKAYLLLENDVPVGSFSLMIFCSPSHQGTPQALLEAVVVTNARRGSGLGKVMISHAMKIAAAAGCYKIMLSSNLKRVAAHRFYEQLGFHQHGISFSAPLDSATIP